MSKQKMLKNSKKILLVLASLSLVATLICGVLINTIHTQEEEPVMTVRVLNISSFDEANGEEKIEEGESNADTGNEADTGDSAVEKTTVETKTVAGKDSIKAAAKYTSGVKTYINSSNTVTLQLDGTDDTKIKTSNLTANNIVVKVGGTTVTPTTKTLSSATQIANGYRYTLTLSGIPGNGALTIEIAAETLTDESLNKSARTVFDENDPNYQKIIIDNQGPSVSFGTNGSTTYAKSNSTTVNVSDGSDENASGLVANSLKYVWSNSATEPADEASFTGTFTNGGEIATPENVTGDNWYLWILAKDNVGNVSKTKSNAFYLDNAGPINLTLTAKYNNATGADYVEDTWAKAIHVEVTATDANSGNKEFQWYNGTTWAATTKVTGNTGSYDFTGTRNATVKFRVIDNLDNPSQEVSIKLMVDATKPTITASNITFGQTLNVTLKDSHSGVAAWQVKAGSATTVPTSGWTEVNPAVASSKQTVTGLTAGTHTIWVKDGVGNTQRKAITVSKKAIVYSATNYSGAFDGTAHGITVSATEPTSACTIYYNEGTELTASNYSTVGSTTAPTYTDFTDGDKTIYWYIHTTNTNYSDVSGSNTVTITKAQAAKPTVTAYNKAYDGQAHGVTVTGVSGGTVQYSTDGTTYSATAPTYTDFTNGAKKVYVKVVGDGNHTDSEVVESSITITKAQAAKPTVTAYNKAYDGKAHGVTVTGVSGGTAQYSIDGTTYLATAPTYTDFTNGAKKVYVKVAGDGNHTDSEVVESSITITKKSITVTGDNKSKVYGEAVPELTATVGATGITGETGTITGTLATTVTATSEVGTYDITQGTIALAENGAFKPSNYQMTYTKGTLTVTAATMDAPVVAIDTDGKVTWGAVTGATSYEIRFAENGTWVEATSGSKYVDKTSAGTKTAYVRAISTSANYTSPSAVGSKSVEVFSLTLSKGTGISAVLNGETDTTNACYYVSGKQVTIDATVQDGYTWSTWTKTAGTDPAATTKSTTVTIGANTTLRADAVDSTAPVIVSATAGTEWDLSNYVDVTATDAGSKIDGYNISSDGTTAPTTWIPVVDDVETTTETKYQYNAAWARVFHHNTHWGAVLFASNDDAKNSTEDINKYSVLENIANYKNSSNWEFMLQYPQVDGTKYNRWIQTSNPVTTKNKISGYSYTAEGGHRDWTGSSFKGIALSSSDNTFIDGTPGSTGWWYAIGAKAGYQGGIPGPSGSSGIIASNVNLWSRIDNLTTITTDSLSKRLGDIRENGTFYVWVKDAAGNTAKKAVTIEKVDLTAPATYTITSTANGTATLTMGDEQSGVERYYFGKTNPSNTNITWTKYDTVEANKTETKTVSEEGVYYLAVQDKAGNKSTTSKAFYKTTFTPGNGATVSPTSVISMTGNSITLPTPSAVDGYSFDGWYDAETGGTLKGVAGASYKPTATGTLYGHWSAIPYRARFLSGNLLDARGIIASSGLTNNDGVYTYVKSGTYSGPYIPADIFTAEKTYIIEYKVKKTSGTWSNIGGHCQAVTQQAFTIDGTNATGTYQSPGTNMSSKNDANVHTVSLKFKYNGGASDNNIYIQPNRGKSTGITIEISDIKIFEVVEEREKEYTSALGALPELTRTGYGLSGWYTGLTDGDAISASTTMPLNGATYYTHWTTSAITFENQTINKNFNNDATETFNVTAATSGTGSYKYTEVSEKNGSTDTNYITITEAGVATIAKATPAGTYTYVIKATDVKSGVTKDAIYSVVIAKVKAAKPTVTAYSNVYDGQAHGVTVTGVSGGTVQYSTNGTSYSTTAPTYKDFTNGAKTVYVKVVGDGNHTDSDVVTSSITVTKRPITVTADNKAKVYLEALPSLTVTVGETGVTGETGTVSGTLATTATASSAVGTYPITQGTIALAENGAFKPSNYDMTFVDGILTISKKLIAYSSSNYSGSYNGTAHGITLTVTEPTSGCTIYYKEGTQLTANNYSTVGSTTAPTFTDFTNGAKTVYWYIHTTNSDYGDIAGSNTVTIKKVKASKPTVTAYNKAYDGQAHGVTVTGVSGGTAQYSTDGTTYSATAPTFTDFTNGAKTVYVKVVGDGNHTDSDVVTSSINITKKSITVTGDNKSKIYGEIVPELTATVGVTGITGETGAITGTPATTVTATSEVGTYDITQGTIALAENGTFKPSNYQMTYTKGTLTVTAATMDAPVVAIDTDGKVTWGAVTGATSYEIRFATTGTWVEATSGSKYVDKTSAGTKTAYVRAISTSSNYTSPSAVGSKSVEVYSLTLSKGTGISAVSNGGTSTTNAVYYVSGKQVAINATVQDGYRWSTWTKTAGSAPASATTKSTTVTIGANTTLRADAISNTVTININKDGSAWIASGIKVSVRNAIDSTTDLLSETVSSGSTATLQSSGSNTLVAGTTYYVFISKDSNNINDMIYSGVSFTGAAATTATVNYYTLTVNSVATTVYVNGTTVANADTVAIAGGTTTKADNYAHEIVATANTGYTFSGWTAGTGSPTIANTSNAETTVKVGAASTITATSVDTTAPVISVSPSSATICKTQNVRISAIENGSGLASTNSYQYQLGTSATTVPSGTWNDYTSGVQQTIGTDLNGTYYLWVKEVKDNVNNTSSTEGTKQSTYHVFGSYEFDNTVPTCTITASPNSNITNVNSITYTFTWNETLADGTFTIDDISVINGTKGTFTETTANRVYTLVVTKDIDGIQTVTVDENVCMDLAGNYNLESSKSITIDTIVPTLESINVIDPESGIYSKKEQITCELYDKGDVNGDGIINNTDVTKIARFAVGSGTLNDQQKYAGDVNGDGIITSDDASILTRCISGYAGYAESYIPNAIVGTVITIEATYSENVYADSNKTAITASTAPELKVAFGGTVGARNEGKATFSSVNNNKIIYTYQITTGDNGVLTSYSYSGTVYDEAGNSLSVTNKALGGYEITADTEKPTCTITASPSGSLINSNTVTYTFTWSETLESNSFTRGDILIYDYNEGSYISLSSYTLQEVVENKVYSLTMQYTQSADIEIEISEGKCKDLAGNKNIEEYFYQTIDLDAPTCTITQSTSGSVTTYTFTWSETLANGTFTADDITVTNGTKGTFSTVTSNKVYTLDVTSTGGSITVTVPADVCTDEAGNGNIAVSTNTTLDVTPPTIGGEVVANIDSTNQLTITIYSAADNVGGSGIDKYKVYNGNTLLTSSSSNSVTVSSNTAWYTADFTVAVIDKKGNECTKKAIDYYTVGSETNLKGLRASVNNGGSFTGRTVRQIENITITETNWTPIGTDSTHTFSGTYYGGSVGVATKTQRNITDLKAVDVSGVYAGLFGCVSNANISHVKFVNADVEFTASKDVSSSSTSTYVGPLAAYVVSSNITDCEIDATSKAINLAKIDNSHVVYLGGLVGYAENFDMKECINRATVTSYTNNAACGKKARTGGAIGYVQSAGTELYHVYNYGTVTGRYDTGGVVGTAGGSSASSRFIIDRCHNYGAVTMNSADNDVRAVGGIVGHLDNNVLMMRSINHDTAVVTAEKAQHDGTGYTYGYVGGIVGDSEASLIGDSGHSDYLCTNEGSVIGKVGAGAGGIAGRVRGGIVSYASNTGSVSGDGTNRYNNACFGGIVGFNEVTYLYYCTNTGSVTSSASKQMVGGIVGYNHGLATSSYDSPLHSKGATLYYCTNSGNVSGSAWIGGIAGYNDGSVRYATNTTQEISAFIQYCTTNGSATISGTTGIGGIVGNNIRGIIEQCTVTGTAKVGGSGVTKAGGIVGTNSDYIHKCTYSSTSVVTGASDIGGIAGESTIYSGQTVESRVQDSKVTAGSVSGTSKIGGIVGHNYNLSTVQRNTYSSTSGVTAKDYAGGIVGYSEGGAIASNTYSGSGQVKATEDYVGGIVGYAISTPITSNTYNGSGLVTAAREAGGIVGYSNGSVVSNIKSAGAVTASGNYAGGIIALTTTTTVTNSNTYSSSGTVSGADYTGGIIGYNQGAASSNKMTYGSVSGSAYVGGIAGYNTHATFSGNNHSASGSITGASYVGGIVGKNDGTVNGSVKTGGGVSTSGLYVGGIVGYNAGTTQNCTPGAITVSGIISGGVVGLSLGTINNCNVIDNTTVQSTAVLTEDSRGLGGIAGWNRGTVQNCMFKGTVKVAGNTGGIVGWNIGGSISKCSCDGTFAAGYTGHNNGGIVGNLQAGTVEECSNRANVNYVYGTGIRNSSIQTVGGIAGLQVGGTIQYCYNRAAHGGYLDIGGLVGMMKGGTIKNSYSIEKVYASYGSGKGLIVGAKVGGTIDTTVYYLTEQTLDSDGTNVTTEFNSYGNSVLKGYLKVLPAIDSNWYSKFYVDTAIKNLGYPILKWENTATNSPVYGAATVAANTVYYYPCGRGGNVTSALYTNSGSIGKLTISGGYGPGRKGVYIYVPSSINTTFYSKNTSQVGTVNYTGLSVGNGSPTTTTQLTTSGITIRGTGYIASTINNGTVEGLNTKFVRLGSDPTTE